MEGYSPHHRMHEGFGRFPVGERHERLHPLGQLFGGRRCVKHDIWIIIRAYVYPFLSGQLHASGVLRSFQGSFGHHSVDIQYSFDRQRGLGVVTDALHSQIVVYHHSLGGRAWRFARAEQLSGLAAGGGGPFEKAGSDRLLHQARHHVAVPVSGADHVFRQPDAPCGLLVDLVQKGVHLFGQHVAEGTTSNVGERKQPPPLPARKLDAKPPLLRREPVRGRAAAKLFPVIVTPPGSGPHPAFQKDLGDAITLDLLQDIFDARNPTGYAHGFLLPLNYRFYS